MRESSKRNNVSWLSIFRGSLWIMNANNQHWWPLNNFEMTERRLAARRTQKVRCHRSKEVDEFTFDLKAMVVRIDRDVWKLHVHLQLAFTCMTSIHFVRDDVTVKKRHENLFEYKHGLLIDVLGSIR